MLTRRDDTAHQAPLWRREAPRRVWRNIAVPPGRAARPEAGSSVAPRLTSLGAPCVRALGTTIAPRRRALFRQTLLEELSVHRQRLPRSLRPAEAAGALEAQADQAVPVSQRPLDPVGERDGVSRLDEN